MLNAIIIDLPDSHCKCIDDVFLNGLYETRNINLKKNKTKYYIIMSFKIIIVIITVIHRIIL